MAQDDNDQSSHPEQHPDGIIADPHSRRRFLRAAVVGTAGAVGAAGVAGVALARGGSKAPTILRPVLFAQQQMATAVVGFQFAWENVDLGGTCTTNYAATSGPGAGLNFYLLFMAGPPSFLQMGTYTLSVTQQFTPNGGPPNSSGSIQTTGTAALPWEFAPLDPNPVLLEKSGLITTACVSTGLPSVPPAFVGSLPFTFAVGPLGDVALFFIHVVYKGNTPASGDQTVFTGNFSGTVAPSTPLSGSATITVTVP